MQFNQLTNHIQQTHLALQQSAVKAINLHLTLRNWLIGFYIVEFEQKGEDRAAYGEKLLQVLAEQLNNKGLSYRNLKLFRQFFLLYPSIGQTVSAQFEKLGVSTPIMQALTAQLMGQAASDVLLPMHNQLIEIGQTASAQSASQQVAPEKLISRLSFSHLVELFEVSNPLHRTFYEISCIKGNWSVRELRRQIHSLYAERSGLSASPEKLAQLTHDTAEAMQAGDVVKSVYAFEFLGLKVKDVVEESDLETALLDHLQQFLLEMGEGFCLEARQKRITIGDEYFFIDLVFYHRILKCHVLVELKMEPFNHINAGQLNTYLNYYKAEVMLPTDNPPVGLLLVTHQNKALVQYATAGMDNKLFVSKYLVELPSTEMLQQFIQKELLQL